MNAIVFLNSILLAASSEGTATDKIVEGTKVNTKDSLMVLLICMTVIMGILLALMVILYIFKAFHLAANRKISREVEVVEPEAVEIAEFDECEEIAAVTAAVYAILLEEEKAVKTTENSAVSDAPFRIKKIRRIR